MVQKKITGVTWEGGQLADELNTDSSLNKKIAKQSLNDAIIFVDPTDNGVRIYGKWKNSYDFGITKELFDIYNQIAGLHKETQLGFHQSRAKYSMWVLPLGIASMNCFLTLLANLPANTTSVDEIGSLLL